MAQFLTMDPKARDYIVLNGSPTETDDIRQRAYMALLIPKNAWLYGASDQGSFLYTLEGIKRTGSIEQLYSSYAEDAIKQQLIVNGYASAVGVKNIQTSPTGTSNEIEIVPVTTPVQSQLNFVSV